MEIQDLKQHIIENDSIETILEALNCNSIKSFSDYVACSNPDGDNPRAINIYKDTLVTINHTRNYSKDIFYLIEQIRECSFSEAVKWTCDLLGLSYYARKQDKPKILQVLDLLDSLKSDNIIEENLEPIDENVLSEYMSYPNKMWYNEGISLATQKEWCIGYDLYSNCITIPIRDSIGSLVGVKARKFTTEDVEQKYFYLHNFPKTRVVYGLYENYKYIKDCGYVVVVESEKSVLKLHSNGCKCAVAIAGHNLSEAQTTMLDRLNVKVVLCYDKDVDKEHLENERKKFLTFTEVYAMIDETGLLKDKESPADDYEKFKELWKQKIKL